MLPEGGPLTAGPRPRTDLNGFGAPGRVITD
jgi:hypothetical protein